MTDSELEELQLQVEGGIFKLPISEMEQLAEHVGLESKDYKGKSKLAMSKVVRAKVEDELGETENKVEYLTELQNFIVDAAATRRNRSKQRGQGRIGENEIGVRRAV